MAWQGQQGSATERGYGWKWQKLRPRILAKNDGYCVHCTRAGRVRPAVEVDHIVPKHLGGTNAEANLQGLCSACHKIKTQKEAADAQGRSVKPQIGLDGWPVE